MTDAYNAADTRQLRKAIKAARQAEAERSIVVLGLMSSPAGRNWVHSILVDCGIFHQTFSLNALAMAFNEGKRSVSLQLLADVVRWAPDQYIQMMREANDKEIANGRRTDSGSERSRSDIRGDDSGRPDDPVGPAGSVESEYEPGLFDGQDTTH